MTHGDEGHPRRRGPHPSRRRFSRVPFEAVVRLVNPRTVVETPLIDLSLRGAMVERPASFRGDPGERFTLEVPLPFGAVVIRMDVSLVHMQDMCMGFRCEAIDLESISHLRRLIELNLGDASVLDRELGDLLRAP